MVYMVLRSSRMFLVDIPHRWFGRGLVRDLGNKEYIGLLHEKSFLLDIEYTTHLRSNWFLLDMHYRYPQAQCFLVLLDMVHMVLLERTLLLAYMAYRSRLVANSILHHMAHRSMGFECLHDLVDTRYILVSLDLRKCILVDTIDNRIHPVSICLVHMEHIPCDRPMLHDLGDIADNHMRLHLTTRVRMDILDMRHLHPSRTLLGMRYMRLDSRLLQIHIRKEYILMLLERWKYVLRNTFDTTDHHWMPLLDHTQNTVYVARLVHVLVDIGCIHELLL